MRTSTRPNRPPRVWEVEVSCLEKETAHPSQSMYREQEKIPLLSELGARFSPDTEDRTMLSGA